MEQTEEGIGIKVYSATPTEGHTPISTLPRLLPEPGRKRKAMAKGMQKTMSQTSMLVNFLPTGTLLTFEMVLPSVYGHGDCSSVNTMMIYSLLWLCTLSCFFFHFTDSFRGPDGKVYYGFVTPKGLAVFKPGLDVETPKDDKYKGQEKEMDQVMESFPLMVGIICNGLFLVFPNTRFGVGCMAA
ncbi:hypothetical protein PTKIN_Ptkin08bG0056100 [Pterospermum kingtungense]